MYQTNLTGKQTGENENIQIYFTILLKERNLLTNVASSLFVVNHLSGKLKFSHNDTAHNTAFQTKAVKFLLYAPVTLQGVSRAAISRTLH